MSDKLNFIYKNEEDIEKLKQHFKDNINRIDPNKKTILFTVPAWTGTAHFRIITHMFALAEKYPDRFNYLYWEEENFPIKWLFDVDIWFQHRAGSIHAGYLRAKNYFPMGREIPIVITDADDDEVNLPPNHPMKELWYAHGKDQMAKFQLSKSDYVITTGRALKQEFTKYNRNDKIKIFMNGFDWRLPLWHYEKTIHEYPIIGWAGLTSHLEDVSKMSKILKVIHDKYPNVKFKIAGITDKDEHYVVEQDKKGEKTITKKNIIDEKQTYKYKMTELFKDFDKDRIELIGVLPISEYGKFYSLWDINLAYVEHNKFTKAKSPIKIVEGAFYKCINVYSNHGGYQNEFTNLAPNELKRDLLKYCAMQTENKEEWIKAISFWVENYNTDLWNNVINRQFDFVNDVFDIKNQVDERLEFYENCIKENSKQSESFLNMVASEEVLKKDWDNPVEDKVWEHL